MASKSCGNCQFLFIYKDGCSEGECRRFPPVLLAPDDPRSHEHMVVSDEGPMQYASYCWSWPWVQREDHWCGEFKEREDNSKTDG